MTLKADKIKCWKLIQAEEGPDNWSRRQEYSCPYLTLHGEQWASTVRALAFFTKKKTLSFSMLLMF